MINTDNKVLACVDRSRFADAVADYAAWAARRLGAPLELLHVIDHHPERGSGDDHSGSIGFDEQEKLLTRLAAEDEARTRSLRDEGREFLTRLRERTLAAGAVPVDVRQRHGSLAQTVAEHEPNVRLLVLGRRGETSDTTAGNASAQESDSLLGGNLEQLVRAVRKPVLAVTEGFVAPQRVMIAFDGGAVTRRGVEMIAASPLFRDMPILVQMTVDTAPGKDSRAAEIQLEWARKTLADAGLEARASMTQGDPVTMLTAQVREQQIDLLVMGANSHSPLRKLFVRSTTSGLLQQARIPVMLLG